MRKLLLLSVVGMVAWVSSPSAVYANPLDTPGAQKSMVCSACHGPGGNSLGNSVPVIAGMNVETFKKAITDFAEGKRPSPEMEPYSKYVIYAGLDEIAAHFAAQKRMPPPAQAGEAPATKRGIKAAAEKVKTPAK